MVSEFTQTETNANPHYTDYVYLGNRPAIQFNDQTPYYLSTDHRTAVIAATDDDANVVWQAYLSDNGQAQVFDDAQIQVNLRGSNQYYDAESGLHYNIHRYFSPTRNQYLTPDPVGLAAGDDLYAFANDRPHEFVDWWGLATEASLLGTFIHNQIFAPQIFFKGLKDLPISTWGGQDARFIKGLGNTWPTGLGGKIPDAYYVDKTNRYLENSKKEFKGSVWELKPAGVYWDQARYEEAKGQVNSYIRSAKRGKWSAGCAGILNLKSELFFWNGNLKRVDFFDDKTIPKQFSDVRRLSKPSGLVFYSVKNASKKQQQELTADAAEKLKRASTGHILKSKIKEIREAATNLTTLEKVGLVVLILAVVILAIAIAAVGVEAVIAAAIAALSWVLSSGLSIMTALALTLGATMTSANAKEKGNKQKKGLLDKFYDKFKSWFD